MADLHRLLEQMARFVRQVTAKYDVYALFSAVVVSQNADGTLELKPDAPLFGPGLSKVAIRGGIPGATITVVPGAVCLLGFANGDVKAPYAILTGAQDLDTLHLRAKTLIDVSVPQLNLVASGGLPVARQGDATASGGVTPVQCLIMPIAPIPAPGPPGGAMVAPGTPILAMLSFPVQPLYGAVVSGNPSVKALSDSYHDKHAVRYHDRTKRADVDRASAREAAAMPMNAGTVTLDASNNASGSGLSLALYNAIATAMQPAGDLQATMPPWFAILAQAIATAVVAHIQTNAAVSLAGAVATIPASTPIAVLPATTAPGTAVNSSATAVTLTVTGSGTLT